jgi:hypothetical protein
MQFTGIDISLNYFAEIILCALSVLRGSNDFSFALQKSFLPQSHKEHNGKILRIFKINQ